MDGVRILLVEDDDLQRMALETGLTDAGFECVEAATGKAAIKELVDDATRFQAVVTDIRLGAGPTGWDVARAARELVPDVPVVYMSGDSAHEWSAHGVPDSVMVSKPYVFAQVITAVATLINARTTPPSTAE